MVAIATGFQMPVSGATRTQLYGKPYVDDPTTKADDSLKGLIHLGEDWAAAWKTPIKAVANGKVVYASSNEGFGNHVIIEHTLPDKTVIYSLYAHLQSDTVAQDQEVVIGQTIGYMGDTGAADGVHLHWEMSRVNKFQQAGMYGKGYDSPTEFATSKASTVDPSAFVAKNPVPPPSPPSSSSSKADLVIQNASVDDTTVAAGDELTVKWEVKNAGSGNAAATEVGVYLSKDAKWDSSDIRLDTNATTSLAKNAVDSGESASFDLPSNLAAGTWHVLVVADHKSAVAEASETNNVWSQKITVAAGSPDLAVGDARVDDNTVRAGDQVRLDWTVANIGNGSAAASDTFIFISKDKNLTSADRQLDHEELGTMSAGESDAEYESFNIPSSFAKGRYYLGIQADGDTDVVESNEGNNIAWVTIDIV